MSDVVRARLQTISLALGHCCSNLDIALRGGLTLDCQLEIYKYTAFLAPMSAIRARDESHFVNVFVPENLEPEQMPENWLEHTCAEHSILSREVSDMQFSHMA